MFKKALACLCALVLVLGLVPANAEKEIPQTLEYTGGVVRRVVPRGTSDSDLLQMAYTLTDMPYIVMNQPYEWEVFVSGGKAPYTIDARLAWQSSLDMDPFGQPWSVPFRTTLEGNVIEHTFTSGGRYFWEFEVTDSSGQSLTFQTRIYEAYTTADETDETTTVGKVNSLISELITDDMSDYSRARVLHDWLIYNANYDYTYTNYDASGVLLKGTGVCDSYARAYLMLCTAAGLECMYVSGTAVSGSNPSSWGNHGWNLVKLGGSWYHVDCTWDDPGRGGYECHDYFCVDDETMARDHRWNTPGDVFDSEGMLIPEATGGMYEDAGEALGDYDFTFTTWPEFFEKFDLLTNSGERREKTIGLYIGPSDASTMYSSMSTYSSQKTNDLFYQDLITSAWRGYHGDLFYYSVTWVDPDSYLRIDEESIMLSIGQTVSLLPSEYNPAEDVFTWTSSDPSVVSVANAFDASASVPVKASVTGVSAGTATITATSDDGLTDSLTVTVLPPHAPDFDLTLLEDADSLTLRWNGIPGATGYRVVRTAGGQSATIAATTALSAVLTGLNADVEQTLHVVAERSIGGELLLSHRSKAITYGSYSIAYTAWLPGDTTVIRDEAFLGSTSLTALYLPDGVTAIGQSAFSGCAALTAIRIPASVTSIGQNAFSGCALRYAEVPSGSYAETWLRNNLPEVTIIH